MSHLTVIKRQFRQKLRFCVHVCVHVCMHARVCVFLPEKYTKQFEIFKDKQDDLSLLEYKLTK